VKALRDFKISTTWTGFKDGNTVSCTWRSQECMKLWHHPAAAIHVWGKVATTVMQLRDLYVILGVDRDKSYWGWPYACCCWDLNNLTKGPIWPKFSRQQLRSCSFWSQELLVPFSSLNCHHQHRLKIALDITLKLKSWNPHISWPQYSSPSKHPKNQVWNPWPTTTSTQMQ
jgi:hypothetical protein